MGWPINDSTFATLNRAFGTSVKLRKQFLQEVGFDANSVDRIFCISTIEHIPEPEVRPLAMEMGRILRPGGLAILTVDLFYDLAPFTSRVFNHHGCNIDVKNFVEMTGLELHVGERSQLCGYPEFDPGAILAQAQDCVQGDVALNTAQALVLRKREVDGELAD
jgi:predicted SAM-dependent methyltransferase